MTHFAKCASKPQDLRAKECAKTCPRLLIARQVHALCLLWESRRQHGFRNAHVVSEAHGHTPPLPVAARLGHDGAQRLTAAPPSQWKVPQLAALPRVRKSASGSTRVFVRSHKHGGNVIGVRTSVGRYMVREPTRNTVITADDDEQ